MIILRYNLLHLPYHFTITKTWKSIENVIHVICRKSLQISKYCFTLSYIYFVFLRLYLVWYDKGDLSSNNSKSKHQSIYYIKYISFQ